jgi:hypothetical protein
MSNKKFKLSADEIEPLVHGIGGCIATDKITVEGFPVRFMYREEPNNKIDSGWRFMSGFESDDYMDDPRNHAVYDVNTIANYDPSIIPLLYEPVGCTYEKADGQEQFVLVTDWSPPED